MKIDKTVRVELSAADIEEAIRAHIAKQVPGISEMKLGIFDAFSVVKIDGSKEPVSFTKVDGRELINDRLEAFAEITLVDGPIAILKREA